MYSIVNVDYPIFSLNLKNCTAFFLLLIYFSCCDMYTVQYVLHLYCFLFIIRIVSTICSIAKRIANLLNNHYVENIPYLNYLQKFFKSIFCFIVFPYCPISFVNRNTGGQQLSIGGARTILDVKTILFSFLYCTGFLSCKTFSPIGIMQH